MTRWILATMAIAGFAAAANKTVDFYFVDVEGGQATLIVTPEKESILVDAGWAGFDKRDAKRILIAAKKAGVKKIDYMVMTHYHTDHVGGIQQLSEMIPVGTFVDHGPNRETGAPADRLSNSYMEAIKTGKHLVVKPGDKLPLKKVSIEILTADGNTTTRDGKPNPLCANAQKKADDPSENARSVGFLLTYGKFKFVDLGDLTWNKELDLACPTNKVGEVDLYLTTHHGLDQSNAPELVHALNPRVAIMNNGAKKGGTAPAWKTVKASPRLQDMWQVHFALAGGKETNVQDMFIANTDEIGTEHYLKVSASPDGAMAVYNSRNKFKKTY